MQMVKWLILPLLVGLLLPVFALSGWFEYGRN